MFYLRDLMEGGWLWGCCSNFQQLRAVTTACSLPPSSTPLTRSQKSVAAAIFYGNTASDLTNHLGMQRERGPPARPVVDSRAKGSPRPENIAKIASSRYLHYYIHATSIH